MKNIATPVFLFLILFLTTACNKAATPNVTLRMPGDALSQAATYTPPAVSHTLTGTPTLVPTSTTPHTATATPTSTPDPRLVYHCVDILQSLPQDASFEGVLAIIGYSSDSDEYLLDLKNESKQPLGNIWSMAVSTDRKKLAYQAFDSNHVTFVDVHTQPIASIPTAPIKIVSFFDPIIDWLNNDQLLINKHRYTPGVDFFKLPSLIVYNPVAGEIQEFLPEDYPEFNVLDPINLVDWTTRIVPDPTLTRLVYPAFGKEEAPIILWDIASSKEINRLYFLEGYGSTPVWLPDGSQFVTGAPIRGAGQYYGEHIDNLPGEPTVGGEELMGMSRDGLLKRLTYLTTTYVAHPGAMSLSPDGRYIAYWLTIEAGPYPGERLAVADLLTGNVRNYCIAGYPDRSFGKSFPPVWSPDGKSLAVTFPVRMQDSNMFDTNVLVLDLEREVAAQVAESAAVSGWMLPAP